MEKLLLRHLISQNLGERKEHNTWKVQLKFVGATDGALRGDGGSMVHPQIERSPHSNGREE